MLPGLVVKSYSTRIGHCSNIAIALQFRKFQQALEEEFGDDIEIVSI